MYDPRMKNLPLFISYPRSGSHWIASLTQLYFNRPKLRNAKPIVSGNNYLFFHDHDERSDMELPHNRIIYLYRDPDDVLFSLSKAEIGVNIEQRIKNLKRHYEKYLLNKAHVVIKYENFKIDLYDEFNKVIQFFAPGEIVDKAKLDKANQAVAIPKLIQRHGQNKYLNSLITTQRYSIERSKFKKKQSKYIYDKIITDNLRQFF